MNRSFSSNDISLNELGQVLEKLGMIGKVECENQDVHGLLISLKLAVHPEDDNVDCIVATNYAFSLGPTQNQRSALRRALSLEDRYRSYLLTLLLSSLLQFNDDLSLSKTIEQLEHLAPELLNEFRSPRGCEVDARFIGWNRSLWQSPDAVTLLSKVVENHRDFASRPSVPVVTVGFDWLDWDTPPLNAAPAPWADLSPLHSPLETVRHPFWGAMVATLDACTGDYEWQSLILRGDLLRSFHRTLGDSQFVLDSLWRSEFGLYPVDPLVITPSLLGDHPLPLVFKTDGRGSSCLPWLKIALDHFHRSEIAIESEGSWRLTDRFRTQLMKDDEHMMAFESVRQRSYRLARSATKFSLPSTTEVAAS